MTQIHVTGEIKSHYKIRFLVRKIMGGIEDTVEYEFIGTNKRYEEFLEVKHQELASEYRNVLFDQVYILPSDSQLLFGDNKF